MAEYIEKEQILEALVASDDPWVSYLQPGIVKARAVVNSLLTADVAPVVHGKWMITGRTGRAMCSNCGNKYREHYSDYFYCPLCGAKMDLEGWP